MEKNRINLSGKPIFYGEVPDGYSLQEKFIIIHFLEKYLKMFFKCVKWFYGDGK